MPPHTISELRLWGGSGSITKGGKLMGKIVKKAIIRDGVVIGYRLYKTGGLFGTLIFHGYEWKERV